MNWGFLGFSSPPIAPLLLDVASFLIYGDKGRCSFKSPNIRIIFPTLVKAAVLKCEYIY